MMMPLIAVPRILAFDTSTARGSIALLEGMDLRAELRLYSMQTHSTSLLSSIDFLLSRMGWTLGDLKVIAVGIGPGSFTGIRIGIATALGLAQSLSICFAGVSGLDVIAHQCLIPDGHIAVILDAHRSQVFFEEYIRRQGRLRKTGRPCLMHLSDLERYLANRHTYIAGDLKVCRMEGADLTDRGWPRPVFSDLFLAAGIGRLAFSKKRTWRSGESIIAEPLYIRPPDAIKNKRRNR
jgi:tRNA threonylcarbamoyladenosine biosynthesis protein TsaB